MKSAIVGLLALLPLVGFAAGESREIVERSQALSAMLAPRLTKELQTAESLNRSRETPPPPEDLNRDLENRVWREEDLANRLGENLISEPPRLPVQGYWSTSRAFRVKTDLDAIRQYSKSVDLYSRLEKSWAERGNLAKAQEMRDHRAKSLERLRTSAESVAKDGVRFVERSQREEFRRQAKLLTEACAAYAAGSSAPASNPSSS